MSDKSLGVESLSEETKDSQTPSKKSLSANPKKNLKKVIVCVDVGSSLNKILYQVEGHDVQYMVMEPEHLTLPPESEASLPSDSGMGRPEDNAWIRFKKGEECHAVGRVASDFKAFVNFKTLKWEIATPKILGAIGAIAEREELGSEFHLDLGVLLPWGEISSTEQLASELKAALRGFYFRHQRLKVRLERYKCVPEGSGFAMWVGMNERPAFLGNNIAFLMFGHRNTSGLFFRKGTLSRSESSTTNLGFYDLIDKMREKVAGLEREDVLRAILTKHTGYWKQGTYQNKISTEIDWSRITKSNSHQRAEMEVQKLQKAYATSLSEYWVLLSNWLNSTLPLRTDINYVLCFGGASIFLFDHVSNYFQGIGISTPVDCPTELSQALNIDKSIKETNDDLLKLNLVNRFTDVWGFFSVFSGYKVEQQEAA